MRLFYRPDTAAMAPHAALAEAGADFELVLVEREDALAPGSPYRAISPHGTVPALEDGDGALLEASAIVAYVGDRFPGSGLMPPAGSRERALVTQWLAYLATTIQPAAMRRSYPERFTADPAGAEAVRAAAVALLGEHYAWIEGELGDRAWLVGNGRTAADLYLFMLVHWGQRLDPAPWDRPAIGAHARRCAALPGVARMLREQGLDGPPA